jgi:hypothetical protein
MGTIFLLLTQPLPRRVIFVIFKRTLYPQIDRFPIMGHYQVKFTISFELTSYFYYFTMSTSIYVLLIYGLCHPGSFYIWTTVIYTIYHC